MTARMGVTRLRRIRAVRLQFRKLAGWRPLPFCVHLFKVLWRRSEDLEGKAGWGNREPASDE